MSDCMLTWIAYVFVPSLHSEVQEELRMMKAERESLLQELEAVRERGTSYKREMESSRRAVQHAKEIQSATGK